MKKTVDSNTRKKTRVLKNKDEKHTMDIYGDLIFHKKPDDADVEDVYHEPKVPGKFAGDC